MDERLDDRVERAVQRMLDEVGRAAPHMGRHVSQWLSALGGGKASDLFRCPRSLPMLILPDLLDRQLGCGGTSAFADDLAFSTVNGYCAMRLIDNVFDGEVTTEISVLPATAFFQLQFQRTYQRWFGGDHPFWYAFSRHWIDGFELMIRERNLVALDEEAFDTIAARKICAAKIPIVAVCYRYNQEAAVPAWGRLVDRLGRRIQLADDLFDFVRDLAGGRPSFFLGEAERRKHASESPVDWIAREGFAWALARLRQEMLALHADAARLGGESMKAALEQDDAHLLRLGEQVLAQIHSIGALARAFRFIATVDSTAIPVQRQETI